ncbi:MAG: S-layer homology domain-containing protein [Bacillota bacterium]|nr:S-layer homology domain-containing protein [Bacillota bacterium]
MEKRARTLAALLTAFALLAVAGAPGVSWADGREGGRGARAAVEFKDVTEYPWAMSAIQALASRGVLQGTAPGLFSPAGLTTRAEMATVLGRLMGWQPTPAELQLVAGFRDAGRIPGWARAWVAVAARNRVLLGFPGGSFGPEARITWAQLAVIAARVFNYPPVPADQVQQLLAQLPYGMETPVWAAEAVAQNVQQGNFDGILAYLYQPDRPVTRAELALFLQAAVQHQAPAPTPPGPQATTVTGTVTAVTSSELGLRLPDGTGVTLPLAGSVTVSVYGQPGSLQDVTVGAQVKVTLDASAHVTSIEVLTAPLPAPVQTATGFAVGWDATTVTLTIYSPSASGTGLQSYTLLPGASLKLNGGTLGQAEAASLLGESVTLGLDAQGRVVAVSGTTPAAPVTVVAGSLVGTATGGTTVLFRNGTFTSVDLGPHPLAFRAGQMVDPATIQAGTAVVVDEKALADGSALVIVQR